MSKVVSTGNNKQGENRNINMEGEEKKIVGQAPNQPHAGHLGTELAEAYYLSGTSTDILHTPHGYLRQLRNGGQKVLSNFTGCVDGETIRVMSDQSEVAIYKVTLVSEDGTLVQFNVPVAELGTTGMMKHIKFAGPSFRTKMSARDLGNAFLDDSNSKFQRRYVYHGFGFRSGDIFLAPSGSILKGGGHDPNLVAVPIEEQHAPHLDLLQPRRKNEAKALTKVILNDFVALQDRAATLPLLGTVGLAVIHRLLPVTTYPTISCIGPSGTGKTSLCRAVQCFFGPFPVDGTLATFSATPNSLERAMHLFSDAVLVIDDLKWSTIGGEKAKYQRLIQNTSDRTGRGRLSAAGKSLSVNTPRCIVILTGEDLLGDEAATVARQIVLPFETVKRNANRMRRVQDKALRFSVLTRVCVEYIQRMEDQVEITAVFRAYENRMLKVLDLDPNRERIASHMAQVATGLGFLLASWSDAGLISDADAMFLTEEGIRALEDRAVEQLNLVHEEDVVAVFVQCLHDLIDTGKARIVQPENRHGVSNMIGFDLGPDDSDQLMYLIPEVAYRAVDRFRAGLGKPLGLSQRSIMKALQERGFTVCNHGNLLEKRLPGMPKRSYLAIRKKG